MRAALLLAVLALGACATATDQSYGLGDGYADYDTVKKATELCKSRGGVVEFQQGGDQRLLADYTCKISKGH